MKPFVYVALDYQQQRDVIRTAQSLAEAVNSPQFGFKVNLDSVASFSPNALTPYQFIREIQHATGKSIFVDMKMWNGARTMTNVAEGCAALGADIVNVYPHAEERFISRVARALQGSSTKLFGVTVQTHYNDAYCYAMYGKSMKDTVLMFTKILQDSGAQGIILPGTQLETVQNIDVLKLCPGIRPEWHEDKSANDQEQIVTHQEAVLGGAQYLVIGSPITTAKEPAKALERILHELN